MGMTMTQKILARHAGLDSVRPGQLIQGQCSQKMLQKQDARQQNHAADHRHRQVSLRCPQSLSRLVLGHPHIGGHGHHLRNYG